MKKLMGILIISGFLLLNGCGVTASGGGGSSSSGAYVPNYVDNGESFVFVTSNAILQVKEIRYVGNDSITILANFDTTHTLDVIIEDSARGIYSQFNRTYGGVVGDIVFKLNEGGTGHEYLFYLNIDSDTLTKNNTCKVTLIYDRDAAQSVTEVYQIGMM